MWSRALAREALVLLGFQAWAAATSASTPSTRTVGSFHDWLQDVEFGVPALNVTVPSVGELEFKANTCKNLTLGGVEVKDHSNGSALNLTINVSGLSALCLLQSNTFEATVSLDGVWISASIAVEPFEVLEGKPLPVAVMMSQCATGLHVATYSFLGVNVPLQLNSAFSTPFKASVDRLLCEQLPGMVNTLGSEALNMASGIASELLFPQPLPPLPQALTPLLDWGTYPPFLLGKAMLAERFAKWRTLSWGVGGPLLVTQNLSIRVGSVEVAGLQTLGEPGLNLTGDNGTVKANASAGHLSVSLSAEIEVAPLQQWMPSLAQPVNLTVDLRDLHLVAEVIAMLSKPTFAALGASQLQMPGCLLECARSAADPPSQSLGMRELELDMTSLALLLAVPHSWEQESLEQDQELAVAVNKVLGAVLRGYLPSLVAVLNGLGGFLLPVLVEKAWRYLDNTSFLCNSTTEGTEGVAQQSTLTGLWGTGLGIVVAGLLLGCVTSQLPCSTTGGKSGDASKTQQTDTAVVSSESNSTADLENAAVSGPQWSDGSVLATSGVPPALAIFYAFVVFAVIFLFLFADLALGTSVDLTIEAAGEVTRFGSLFAFSLIGTIRSTWTAEAYAISVLTLLFSGLWPLLKLVLLLVTWLTPVSRISMRTRGWLLSLLDIWGKFSFLDSWFLVLCMSAFSMQWQGADAALHVRTRPTVAYFAFLLATMLSLLLGNVASSYHHHAQDAALEGDAAETAAGFSQRIAPGQRQQRSVRVAVTLLLMLAGAVTMIGAAVPSFRFSMSGLGSNLIYGAHQHTEDYSLISVGMAVSTSNPGSVGLVLLQVVFLFLCVAVPMLLFLALLVLWVVPLDTPQQEGLLHCCRVLDAWATLDVFVLTVAVGHAEFGRLASRLLEAGSLAPLCGLVQATLGDACFDLDLELLPGFGMLLVAGLFSLVVPKLMQRLCRAAPVAKSELTSKPEPPQESTSRSTSASGGQAFEGNFTMETSSSSGPDAFVPNRSRE